MIKETYRIRKEEISLNVTQSKIDSMRKKDIVKNGCRVYENGYIGISGIFGDNVEEGFAEAIANLDNKVPYKFTPTTNSKRSRDTSVPFTEKEFCESSERLVNALHEKYTDLIFSNKINMCRTTITLKNDAGLNYSNTFSYFAVSLIVKHVNSVSIFDSFVSYYGSKWNHDAIFSEACAQLDAFSKTAELPDATKFLVSFNPMEVGIRFGEFLNARLLGAKASPYSEKFGEKLFSDKLTLFVDRTDDNPASVFFDDEGTTLENDRINLIENGRFVRGYCDKFYADMYGYDNTASAEAAFDDVPQLGVPSLNIDNCGKTLAELTKDTYWINLYVTSGGDCTNDGVFASPVQLGYLMKGTEYVGKLPEFSVSGSIYDIFGDDFVGVSKDKAMNGERVALAYMNISK